MVRIITDSAADFELWELEKRDITCIPLVVMFKETEYHENVNLTKAEFYDLLAATKTLPKTAQASPQILLDLFEQAKAALLPTVSAPWVLLMCMESVASGASSTFLFSLLLF